MPVPPYEPQPDLTTQRVPGGRLAALAVVAVAIVVVGTLIWKPWDSGIPAATSRPAAAIPTATAGPLLSASAVAPEASGSDGPGFARLVTGEGPYVQCTYALKGRGSNARRVLTAMTVAPPIIGLNDGPKAARVDTVEWHVDLEANSLSSIFNAEWFSVLSSSVQDASITPGHPPRFVSVDIAVPPPRQSSAGADVYRATVVVTWVGSTSVILEQRLNPTSYGPSDNQRAVPMVEGCPETLVAR